MRKTGSEQAAQPSDHAQAELSMNRVEIAAVQQLQAEPTFQALLHAAPDAIVIVDHMGRVVVANQVAESIFGYTQHELLGQPIELLMPDRFHTLHLKHRAAYKADPRTRPMGICKDLIARRKDGTEFPVEVSLSPLQTADGLLVTSVIRDVTERKRIEVELRASQARLAGVLDIAEDAIISVDTAQIIRLFNQGAEKIFGYSAQQVIGQPLNILLPERFRAIHRQHVQMFGESGQVARRMGERKEIFGLRKNGEEFPADASISQLSSGDDKTFTVILRDITDRKRAAEELERQVQRRTAYLNTLLTFSKELFGARGLDAVLERALSHALTVVPEAQRGAIYLAEDEGQRLSLRASAGFNRVPSFTRPIDFGIIGLAFTTQRLQITNSAAEFEALVPEMRTNDRERVLRGLCLDAPPTGAVAIPLRAHRDVIGVLLLLRVSGDGPFAADAQTTLEGLANFTAAAILEEHNQQRQMTLSNQLARLEEQQRSMAERLDYAEAGMLQAARLAAVGQLAASIAHEINNPLYAARNSLFLLEEDLPAELRSSPYFSMASDQLTRIAGIIERMRDFYRPARGEMAQNDLNQLLEETLALAGLNLRHGAINMIFAPAHDLLPVICNADQLRQVFLNLVLNAIDAMPEGGTLTVRTEAGPTVALVEIQDTGIGIPEEAREHLFEPFWTNKPHGTGLGLSISAHIVTQHGGRIEVESSVGEGSTFRVILPYETHV
ncbi:MAG TPA: PAS domain S-box protein [Herpetosiphonaceae bacterium]